MLTEESCGLTKSFSKSDSDMSEYMVMPSSAAHSTRASSHTKNVKFMCDQFCTPVQVAATLILTPGAFPSHEVKSCKQAADVAQSKGNLLSLKVPQSPLCWQMFFIFSLLQSQATTLHKEYRAPIEIKWLAGTLLQPNKHIIINTDKMQTIMVQSAFTARLPQRCPAHNAERLRARAALRSSKAHRIVAAAKPQACSCFQTAAWVG